MEITITPEMIEAARKKKAESDAQVKNMDNNDPENPEEPYCIGCI